eukprot:m.228751 g.228751  ORF g.228751 m.228751 type:complete len:133 (+) comp19250_c1_seq48:3668-4066(+)
MLVTQHGLTRRTPWNPPCRHCVNAIHLQMCRHHQQANEKPKCTHASSSARVCSNELNSIHNRKRVRSMSQNSMSHKTMSHLSELAPTSSAHNALVMTRSCSRACKVLRYAQTQIRQHPATRSHDTIAPTVAP